MLRKTSDSLSLTRELVRGFMDWLAGWLTNWMVVAKDECLSVTPGSPRNWLKLFALRLNKKLVLKFN